MSPEKSSLQLQITSVSLNVLSSCSIRFISFLLNAFIFRRISTDVLGVINVRLSLLEDSIVFLGREAFRRSTSTTPSSRNEWNSVLTTMWLVVPNTILWSFLLLVLWTQVLSLPSYFEEQYVTACFCIGLGSCFSSFSEVFILLLRSYHFIRVKPFVDLLILLSKGFLLALGVYLQPEKAILIAGLSQLLTSFLHLFSYLFVYLFYLCPCTNVPFSSLRDLIPKMTFDSFRLRLTLGFYTQSFLMILLSEGERLLMSFFDLLSFSQQGVFDVVSNLGALPARLLFRPLEDSAYFYFSSSLSRNGILNSEVSKILSLFLKLILLFGLTLIAFGVPFSRLLLDLYGGATLSEEGVTLLRLITLLVVVLGLNGLSECFVMASYTPKEIERFNGIMILFSFLYLLLVFVFSYIFDALGFILANIFNMSLRLSHHYFFIVKQHQRSSLPLLSLAPRRKTQIFLLFSLVFLCVSETVLYSTFPFLHFLLGVFLFGISLSVMFREESSVLSLLSLLQNKDSTTETEKDKED